MKTGGEGKALRALRIDGLPPTCLGDGRWATLLIQETKKGTWLLRARHSALSEIYREGYISGAVVLTPENMKELQEWLNEVLTAPKRSG